jgi:mannose-6-phosphate isomerase-like protein (cupin superfamily)
MRLELFGVVLVFCCCVGSAQGQAPEGWAVRGTVPQEYVFGVDTDVKYSGRASGFIASKAKSPKGFATLRQVFKAELYRGKRIRMTAIVKSQNVAGWSGLWMRVDSEALSSLAFDNMENRKIRKTTDWKKYDIVLDVPEDAAEIYFGFLLSGRGQVWVDDFSFEVVRPEIKPTGRPQPYVRTMALLWNPPVQPVNLGFED